MNNIRKSMVLFLVMLMPLFSSAAPNYGLTLDGVNDYVETSTGVIPSTGNFTVEFWATCPTAPNSHREMISQGSDSSSLFIGTDPSNNIRVWGWTLSPAIPFPVGGGWHHFAIVRSATNADFYMDGVLRSSKGSSVNNPSASTGLRLGRQWGSYDEYWPGNIGDLRVWNRDLGPGELQQVLTGSEPNLVAWWKFNEGAGTTCTSVGSTTVAGTLMNGPFWIAKSSLTLTSPTYGLSFDGVDDYVETSAAVIPSSGDFTVECWAECPVAPGTHREIFSQGSAGNALYVGTDPSNNLRLGDGWNTPSPAVPMPIGGWHHFALVRLSTNAFLYIDGVLKAVKGSALVNPSASTGFRFGKQYSTHGEYWRGGIADVRVWNRALGYSELAQSLYGTEANLVAWWDFKEMIGTTCTSKGSSTVTGTLLNGAALFSPFTFIDTGSAITITGHTHAVVGALEIPAAINGKPVTSIADSAFAGSSGLSSVTIPASVTTIGNSAFANSPALTNALFLGNAPAMGSGLFDGAAGGFTVGYLDGATDFTAPTWQGYPTQNQSPEIVVEQPTGTALVDGTATVDFGPVFMAEQPYAALGTTRTVVFTIRNAEFSPLTGLVATVTGPQGGNFHATLAGTTVPPGGRTTCSVSFALLFGDAGLASATLHLTSNDAEESSFDIALRGEMVPLVCVLDETGDSATIVHAYTSLPYALTIPSTVEGKPITRIGVAAFMDCTQLTGVTIPGSVIAIEDAAFSYGCTALETVTLTPGLKSIGVGAFSECTSLRSIAIPATVTHIGNAAFALCAALTNVTIPASVTTIGNNAFLLCTALTAIDVADANLNYCSVDGVLYDEPFNTLMLCPLAKIGQLTIPDGVTTIAPGAVADCTGLTGVTIPSSMTAISPSTFSGCTGLENVVIPVSVTSIGESAFAGCTGLENVVIPASVTSIGASAFSGCTSLETVVIPASVTSIGASAFSGCTGLKIAVFQGSAPAMGSGVFAATFDLFRVRYHMGAAGFTSPTWNGYDCENLETSSAMAIVDAAGAVLTDGTYSLDCGSAHVLECNHRKFTIRNTGADLLTGLTFTMTGTNAQDFTVKCSTNVVRVGESLPFTVIFTPPYNDGTLVPEVLRSAVLHISSHDSGDNPFEIDLAGTCLEQRLRLLPHYLSNNMAAVMCGRTTFHPDPTTGEAPDLLIASDPFHQEDMMSIRGIPAVWGDGINPIGGLYYACIKTVTFPDNLEYLGDWSLAYSALKTVTVPGTVTDFGVRVFSSCMSMTNAIIEPGITQIPQGTFAGCWHLTSVSIPSTVTNIGASAFEGCEDLRRLALPASVTNIGANAFYSSGRLTINPSLAVREFRSPKIDYFH